MAASQEEINDFIETLILGFKDMPEEIKTLVLPEMLSAEKLKSAEFEMDCPHCAKRIRKRVAVATPDYQAWSRAIEMLWNRVYGKPKEAPAAKAQAPEITQAQVTAMVKNSLETLLAGDLTDEQLAKLASA